MLWEGRGKKTEDGFKGTEQSESLRYSIPQERFVLVESENFVCFSGISGLRDTLSEQDFLQGAVFSGV